MDILSQEVRCHGVCYFVDDVVFIEEAHNRVNAKLEVWRQYLKGSGSAKPRPKLLGLGCGYSRRMRIQESNFGKI